MSGENQLLTVKDLQVEFSSPQGPVCPVDGVSFQVAPGEILGLVGESGCGKSLTSRAILGLLRSRHNATVKGEANYLGENLVNAPESRLRSLRGNKLSMIFQDPMTSLNPAYRVGDQLAEVARIHKNISRSEARQGAVDMLKAVGLPHPSKQAHGYPHEFSGGMRQRAVIGMALMNSPDLLIADEPTTALDVTVQAQILDLLKTLRRERGTGILFITHDLAVVSQLCDRVAVMYSGRIVEEGNVNEVFSSPCHPYTEGLLRSIPKLETRHRLEPVPGKPPQPGQRPPGCPFQPRCPLADDVCSSMPPLSGTKKHRVACHHRGVSS